MLSKVYSPACGGGIYYFRGTRFEVPLNLWDEGSFYVRLNAQGKSVKTHMTDRGFAVEPISLIVLKKTNAK